ncbi:MAG TPA: hypothetical protein VGY55_12155 [Pirellulales bacterium]|jgi:ribosomal protein S27E|nr:hypothetical protein [Pirellulales bacterium]
MKVTCKNCGSEYWFTEQTIPARNKGGIPCRICGVELYEWNGERHYMAELLKEGSPPKPDQES